MHRLGTTKDAFISKRRTKSMIDNINTARAMSFLLSISHRKLSKRMPDNVGKHYTKMFMLCVPYRLLEGPVQNNYVISLLLDSVYILSCLMYSRLHKLRKRFELFKFMYTNDFTKLSNCCVQNCVVIVSQ